MFTRSSSSWFFFPTRAYHSNSNELSNQIQNLCSVVVISLISVLFLFGKLFTFSINFTLSRGYFLFCFHHIQSTHTNWGGILLVVVQLVFRSAFVNTLQKLTLSQTNRTAFFLFCATCSFIFSVYSFTFWRNIPTVWVCVFFCLTSTQTERSISFFLPIFYEITTNLLRSNFLFLENKIDLLAIIGGAICVSLGDFIFFFVSVISRMMCLWFFLILSKFSNEMKIKVYCSGFPFRIFSRRKEIDSITFR